MIVRGESGSSPSRRMIAEGVVSFTLNEHPKPMQSEGLLSITPEAMVEAILDRRRATASKLPDALHQRTEENNRAYALAKEAKDTLHALKAEENATEANKEALKKAQSTYDEHESFRRRTSSRLQTLKNSIKDSKEAIEFWDNMADGEWGHLLEDSNRVASGGESSYAKSKHQHSTEVSNQ
jgi:hypothetical protein